MLPWLPSLKGVPTPVLQVGQSNVSGNTATIYCGFPYGSYYCIVCCSPSVPVGLAGSGYLSTTRGTEVTVSLQGLTRGQMYYCKAAATNTNSNNCAGPVVGGVKVFFSFMTSVPITSLSSPTSATNASTCEYCLYMGRYGEVWQIWGGMGRYGEMWGDIWRDVGRYGEIWGDKGR